MTEETPTAEGAPGAAASAAATAEPSRTAESDFKSRAQRDPDWAWEQLRGFQSKADKAASAEEKYNELVNKIGTKTLQYIDGFGGDTVSKSLDNYAAMRNSSDKIGAVVMEFERTGQLPAREGSEPNADADDEYVTPEEKELRTLRTEVQELRGATNETTYSRAKEMFVRHMEKVFTDFGFDETDREPMRASAMSQIRSWQTMGPAGEAALKAVMTDDGYKTVKGIMLANIEPAMLLKAQKNIDLRKQQGLAGLATDGPGRGASAGRDELPSFETVQELAAHVRANPDAHDSR